MESQKFKPNFAEIKCSWQIILLHVYEKTLDDSNHVFTSLDVREAFGCSINSAIRIINRGVAVGTYIKDTKISGIPYYFKLTTYGKESAARLIMRQLISDKEDEMYGRR